jgi:hypothetical protein
VLSCAIEYSFGTGAVYQLNGGFSAHSEAGLRAPDDASLFDQRHPKRQKTNITIRSANFEFDR